MEFFSLEKGETFRNGFKILKRVQNFENGKNLKGKTFENGSEKWSKLSIVMVSYGLVSRTMEVIKNTWRLYTVLNNNNVYFASRHKRIE